MKLKSMLKFALSALLLSAGLTAFAADGDGETPTAPKVVQLSNGTAVSWADYDKAINDPSTIDVTVDSTALHTARVAYTKARSDYNQAKTDLTTAQANAKTAQDNYNAENKKLTNLKDQRANLPESEKYEKSPVSWLRIIQGDASAFQTAYNAYMDYLDDGGTKPESATTTKVYYKYRNSSAMLVLSFEPADTYTPLTVEEFWTYIQTNASQIEALGIYLGQTDGVYNYTKESNGILTCNSYARLFRSIVRTAINELQTLATTTGYFTNTTTEKYNNLTKQIAEIEGGTYIDADGIEQTIAENKSTLFALQTALDAANAKVTRLNNIIAAGYTHEKEDFDTALADYNKAVEQATTSASAVYQHVTLTGEVDADVAITVTNFEGIIEGNQNVINIVGNITLFKNFNGTLTDAAINGGTGSFATGTAKGTFQNVTYCAGSTYRYYNDHGAVNTSAITSLGQLAYVAGQANSGFGINYKAEGTKKLVKVGVNNEYKVYNINVYNSATSQWTYANLVSTSDTQAPIFHNGGELTPGVNTFVGTKSEDLAEYVNVIYENECRNAVITDKKPFYSPISFTANNLNYARTLVKNNAVCLPFALNAGLFTDGTILCEYYGEAEKAFQFKQIGDEVKAYTPALLWNTALQSGETSFVNLGNVKIEATPSTKFVTQNAKKEGDKSVAFGLLASFTTQEICTSAGGDINESYRVYAMNTNTGEFVWTNGVDGSIATYPAFRTVIYSGNATPATAGAPRRIVILNEKGIDITGETTGIEEIEGAEEAAQFSVATGVGEIVFTSEADFGKVDVYSLDGKVVAVADVMAGTTTVNLAKGVYIVMGKKVMVK